MCGISCSSPLFYFMKGDSALAQNGTADENREQVHTPKRKAANYSCASATLAKF
jgi:hypothetical protein